MTTRLLAVAAMLLCMFATPAAAKRHHHKHHHHIHHIVLNLTGSCLPNNDGKVTCSGSVTQSQIHTSHPIIRGSDPRPHAWCGWWLRQHLGIADKALNLARNWARVGTNAGGPQVGAIVVWRHHVGIITGRTASGWIVKSGNDGHAVRERERSLRGAIAFRHV